MSLSLWMARHSLGAAVFAAFIFGPAQATTLHLNARKIYERAVSSNITLSPDGSELQLKSGEVIQDDGPASGFSYKLNREMLSPSVKIRKQLLIPDPQASKAVIMVGRGGNYFKTGRRVLARRETPMCNLFLTMMDRMGVRMERFGDSTGRLEGLDLG